MDRGIFHCDCNGFYASVEEKLNPSLRMVPMAVSWSPDRRHGVILAKNELAKGFGVQTAEPVVRAVQKCPELVLTPARHSLYQEYCERINAIYGQYTDLVERFGIDESYLDVTGSLHLFGGEEVALANEIRERVSKETGLTISVGVSFNKAFAKLGSDYKKPNAVTYIGPENFREIVWPLPASALLYVGKVTAQTLEGMYIRTIGDLARAQPALLTARLGKMGEQLHRYANGWDESPVAAAQDVEEAQSVGNSCTYPNNLVRKGDIRAAVTMISETVAARLRHSALKCSTVQITVKDTGLKVITRQKGLEHPTFLARELEKTAMELLEAAWPEGKPIRMLAVTGTKLTPAGQEGEQLSFFESKKDSEDRKRLESLEHTVDRLRARFGGESIARGSLIQRGKNDR